MGRTGRVGMRRFLIGGVAVLVLVAASAAVAMASGWSIQHTPNPPAQQQGSGLGGVSCSSGRACTATGNSVHTVNTSGIKFTTLAERWNGTKWSIKRTPNPTGAMTSLLPDVSCSSGRACTAVGSYLTHNKAKTSTLAERWNGTRWSIQHTPNPPGPSRSLLTGVPSSSTRRCSAVGHALNTNNTKVTTLAERWNGTRWLIQHTPKPTGAHSPGLNSVSCFSRSACTAVGS